MFAYAMHELCVMTQGRVVAAITTLAALRRALIAVQVTHPQHAAVVQLEKTLFRQYTMPSLRSLLNFFKFESRLHNAI